MRPAEVSELPRTALSLAKLADENGWDVSATHAVGVWEAKGRPPRDVTSIAVRMAKQGARVAAIWVDGKFWHALNGPFRRLNAAQVKELIRGVE